MDVAAIEDQAAIGLLILKCGPHDSGSAVGKGRHGVIKMGKARDPGLERCLHGLITGIGMARRQNHSGCGQFAYVFECAGLRRQGHKRLAVLQAFQQGLGLRIKRTKQCGIMNALAFGRDEGAFDMDSNDTWYACLNSVFHGTHGGIYDVRPV